MSKNILISSDDLVLFVSLKSVLKNTPSINVEHSSNGFSTISKIKEKHFDLIIMDCEMPMLDGYNTTKKIRNGEAGIKNKDIPILGMTTKHLLKEEFSKMDHCFNKKDMSTSVIQQKLSYN